MKRLRPFWRYYGGKNRAARLYPQPEHDTIIEPFAGAAGYACRYPDRRVILVDKSPIIAGLWRYLIGASEQEILSIPDVPEGGTVDDLSVCQEARWLVGFWCNNGTVGPCKRPSAWSVALGQQAHNWSGWGYKSRQRVASQLRHIRHWQVIKGEYADAPDIEATHFVDPPYNNRAGSYYPEQPDDFSALGEWCRSRRGLVIVCENQGAEWLPFKPLKTTQNTTNTGSKEAIWLNRRPCYWQGVQTSLLALGGEE